MNTSTKIIIIGGGIAGPALALFLKRIGITAQIFEANPSPSISGAGLNIAPNGVRVLRELGLEQAVMRRGSIASSGIFKNAKGAKLAQMTFTNLAKYDAPAVSIKRQTIYEILFEALQQEQIPIHFNKRLSGLDQQHHTITAHFEDGQSVTGDLVVGADGVNSQVRALVVAPENRPAFTGVIGVGGIVAKNKLPMLTQNESQNLQFIYGQQGFFGYGGVNERELMWWTNVLTDQPIPPETLRQVDQTAERTTLLHQYGQYNSPIPDIIRQAENFTRVNVFDIISLPHWSKGRALLIGDAAHAVSPNSGQGTSMALEDAMLLAKLIRREAHLDAVFTRFEAARKPRVERIVEEGRKKGEDKLIVGGLEQFIREMMIRIFVNLFADKGNDWLYSYKLDWD